LSYVRADGDAPPHTQSLIDQINELLPTLSRENLEFHLKLIAIAAGPALAGTEAPVVERLRPRLAYARPA
jgi:hypothetical protein